MAAPRVRQQASIDSVPFGKYLLLGPIGQGRLGSVHRALLRREGMPDERFAIKRFAPELSQDRRFAERAARVLSRASQITHPAHCAIAEVDRAEDTLYAALEWVSGRDLKRIGVALRERGETMPAALVAYVGCQVAEVLAEAHGLLRAGKPAPLLHGELSAVDILIGFDGRVRLTGLGSAELSVAAQVEATRTAYHAPEISLGAACSEQTDVFSLGACMYQVLSLKAATDSQTDVRRPESQITQIIPRALKQIVDRSLAMKPEARWQSAAELAHALQSWRSTQTQPADAIALSAFMRGLFDGVPDDEERTRPGVVRPMRAEPARDEPWGGVAEHTPANGVLMQQLAADMVGRAQPTRAAEVGGTKSILEAIVNPEELAPQPQPQPQPQAEAAARLAIEGWDDAPWEAEETAVAIASGTPQQNVIAQRSPLAAAPPARRPTPAPKASTAPTPAPAPVRSIHMPMSVMPVQPSPPAMLESWQTERRAPWLMPSLIAAAALGVLFAGLFMFGGESSESAASAEPAARSATESATGAATRAQTALQDRAPNAAIEVTPSAREPVPQAATPPGDTKLRADSASEPRRRADAPRAWELTQRGERRERRQAPVEPDALYDDVEQPTAHVERATAPAEAEEPAAALSMMTGAPMGAVPTEEPTPAEVAPPTVAPVKPAVTPSVSRGPTRAAIVIERVTPRFPARAKRMAIDQGVVTIEFTIDKNGGVKDAVVVSAEPERVFEDAALKAITQWKYQPKLVNGAPTEARQRFTFRFE